MPFVAPVAIAKRAELQLYSNDDPALDSAPVRDYVHVVHLTIGHPKALQRAGNSRLLAVGFGTGQGCSVIEMVRACERAIERKIPCGETKQELWFLLALYPARRHPQKE